MYKYKAALCYFSAVQARQMLKKLSRTRMFASNVRKAWRLDQCGEDVLITFSVREDVVRTAVTVHIVLFVNINALLDYNT